MINLPFLAFTKNPDRDQSGLGARILAYRVPPRNAPCVLENRVCPADQVGHGLPYNMVGLDLADSVAGDHAGWHPDLQASIWQVGIDDIAIHSGVTTWCLANHRGQLVFSQSRGEEAGTGHRSRPCQEIDVTVKAQLVFFGRNVIQRDRYRFPQCAGPQWSQEWMQILNREPADECRNIAYEVISDFLADFDICF